MSFTVDAPPVSNISIARGFKSRNSAGYNRNSYSNVLAQFNIEKNVCSGTSSFTRTYDIHIRNQFQKLVAKMNMTAEQLETFELITSALLEYVVEGKIIMEDSIDSEVVIGRRKENKRKLIAINEFGDVMFSIKSANRDENHREFLDFGAINIHDLLRSFLA
ncbi:MAG: hypothetical protein KDC12_04925 [Flavobacteriales bacterium]|nr:hypothetical protein [Flavobacteriales bacterium]